MGNTPGASGALKDSASGANLGASVAITSSGSISTSSVATNPVAGTPLYQVFNGYVDFAGTGNADAAIQVASGGLVTYTISGLDPAKRYGLAASAVRGGSGGSYPLRWTLFRLNGALSFTSQHSLGTYTNGLAANEGAINTGINTNGNLVNWESIEPPASGVISLVCTQYMGSIPGGTASGPYGYAATGLRLTEYGSSVITIQSARPSGNNRLVAVFSEPLDPVSALAVTNYALTNTAGPVAITSATLAADQKTVTLGTASQGPYLLHTLRASNLKNASGTTSPSSGIVYTNVPLSVGYVKRELYLNLTNSSIATLTNSPKFPDSPDQVAYLPGCGWPTVNINDQYGGRLRGWIVPPVSGDYYLAARVDDTMHFYFSTDEFPEHKVLITYANSCCQGYDVQSAGPFTLEAGKRYYFETLMKEATGGDYLYVAWKMPTNANWTVIPGGYVGNYLYPGGASIAISQQPTNTSTMAGQPATFRVTASGTSSVTNWITYQWQRNGIDIQGATEAAYTVPTASTNDHGATYRVLVGVPGAAQFSSAATLTVTPDNVRPVVKNIYNLGTTNVIVEFSEPVVSSTATNATNYVFLAGATTLQAQMTSTDVVKLTTSPLTLGSNYTVRIDSIRDWALPANVILTNTMAPFTARPFAVVSIGTPGSLDVSYTTNGFDATSSGSRLGEAYDQAGMNYLPRTGDFDIRARFAGLDLSQVWAKAGLMARQSTDPGSRYAAALATPAMAGCFFSYRDTNYTQAKNLGAFPPNYPYQWLRLKRAGNVFTGYAGYDGTNWVQLGTVTLPLPSELLVGTVFSSQSESSGTAQVRDFSDTTTALLSTVVPPYEPPGPSTRSSGITITEIMYKPAARSDLRNAEFVEVYNSYPYFYDISGYRLQASEMDYTFPPGSVIPGGAYWVIAAVPQDVETVYGLTGVRGPYVGSLKASDTLRLYDEKGGLRLKVAYQDDMPWPIAADGAGHSLALVRPSYGQEDPRAWSASEQVGGSPGRAEPYIPSPLRKVSINEILAHTDLPDVDYVELYNQSGVTVDISECILTDDPATNRFVIPAGTTLPPRGFASFTQAELGFGLSAAGETVFLFNRDRSRVLDAVRFPAQENGMASGRSPDGSSEWYRLAAKTPGTNNAALLKSSVVINEIMYHPLSGDDDAQYVELYNRSTLPVDLGLWKLRDGVSYSFPSNTILAANSYLVVARNLNTLLSNYPSLNVFNTMGNFDGSLSSRGERLVLTMPDWIVSTNSRGEVQTERIDIPVNEVTYGTGGRWGQWADGGGSSLELINPESNTRLAPNWSDSDETGKSTWVTIESTGVLDHGRNMTNYIGAAQIGLLDPGECLVDNLELITASGTNCVLNPGLESGIANWWMQGCHSRSALSSPGDGSATALHIRATDQMFTGLNSCQVSLGTNDLAAGQTATLRFRARWLRGCPEPLMRIVGNWLEATGRLPVPLNLGTPGQQNSTYTNNAGPAIYEVAHTPTLPAAFQQVVVTAKIHDPDELSSAVVQYRVDPNNSIAPVVMRDDGLAGDQLAGDGIYSAQLPGQNTNTLLAFWILATDKLGKTSRFPSPTLTNLPPRECLVLFGTAPAASSFGTFHMLISATNNARWTAMLDLSNEPHEVTFVNGSRVVYNGAARFGGSPYHQGFNSPTGALCHYKWIMPDDDRFLGETAFNKVHQPGNGAGDDASLQREQLANTLLRHLGVPWLNRRFINVFVNGSRRGTLMEDVQRPDGDLVNQYWPDDSEGWLYKMQPWFEFQVSPGSSSIGFVNASWCNLMPYTTTGGIKKIARYRYNYLVRRTTGSMSDFTNIFSLIDAASATNSPSYVSQLENMADMENWMRMFAANHAAGNWDSFGAQNSQNIYGYFGAKGTRYSLLMWDFNIVFGNSGSWGPGANLFTVNSQDPNMKAIYNTPVFRRMYWRALQELINGPLDAAQSGPLLDAKYNEFLANGFNMENPVSIKDWLTQARTSINNQLAAENTSSFTVNQSVTLSNNLAIITGTAPVNARTIAVNGVPWPVTWTSLGAWRLVFPVKPGSNALSVTGIDMKDTAIPGMSNFVSVIYNGAAADPARDLALSEIMFDPLQPNTSFVELHNRSTNAYDLSGWEFRGLSLTFPSGTAIQPGQSAVFAENRTAFSALYGVTNVPLATFDGSLQNNGETLSLIRSGTNAEAERVVTRVRYGSALPWPTNASNSGRSLQLRDPSRDNWRVANWAVDPARPATPGTTNSTTTNLNAFPTLWINEVQVINVTGITNRLGQRSGWLELFNPGSNTVSLDGLYLSTNAANVLGWAFPAGSSIPARQFKLVFADAAPGLTTPSEWHANFTLPSSGMVLLGRLDAGEAQVLDYLDYPALTADRSYDSIPDAQSFFRQECFFATPGQTNNPASPILQVFINEWMADNTTFLADPADGDFEDWFELYNAGSSAVDLSGYYLTDTVTNKFQSEIPNNHQYIIPPHGYLLVWADGERGQNSTNRADLHVNFKLGSQGESIALYSPDGTPVDIVDFGPQTPNVSEGLYPDAAASRMFFGGPSPRSANALPNTAPFLAAITNRFATQGKMLYVQAEGSDGDLPPQTLYYTLLSAPSGAVIQPFTGLISWLPPVSPATNGFQVVVSDNGSPSLNATQSFSVVTYPPANLQAATESGTLVFRWNSTPGEQYQMEFRERLEEGQWLPTGAVLWGTGGTLSVTNLIGPEPAKFFRLNQLP